MHDLFHDLALDASKNYCKTLEATEVLNHVSDAVWLKVTGDIELKISKESFERVQTPHLAGGISPLDEGILSLGNLIPNFTHVTVLVFASHRIKELPNSAWQLKYLRYLDISTASIKELSDSITKLYDLQTLRYSSLEKFPKKLGNLINMRHMHSSSTFTPNMNSTLIGIERLTSLQTLTFFVVGRDKKLRLENMGGLNNLAGKLCIYGLEEVTNMGDVIKANLSKKTKIQPLEFRWKYADQDDLLEDEEYNDLNLQHN